MSVVVPLELPRKRDDEAQLDLPFASTQAGALAPYLRDASNLKGYAETLWIPSSEYQLAEYLKSAASEQIPVTVEGAHTGLVGGGVPQGGAVISLERLTRMGPLDTGAPRPFLRVDAGVPLGEVQKYVESRGYFYPPDPTGRHAHIGATAATNASGPRTFKYGATRRHVKRIRLVLSSGEVLALERGRFPVKAGEWVTLESPQGNSHSFKAPTYTVPPIKNTAGYYADKQMDLIDLVIGSEGTLGVISELELFLLPLPEMYWGLVLFFSQEREALKFVTYCKKISHKNLKSSRHAGVQARAIEYIDGKALALIRAAFPEIPREAGAAIYVEQETVRSEKDRVLERWLEALAPFGISRDKLWCGWTDEAHERMKAFRHAVPLAVKELIVKRRFRKVGTDMAVPDNRLAGVMKMYTQDIRKSQLDAVTFGHIGNNHLHVNLLPRTSSEWDKALKLHDRWIRQVLRWGGTVSGEHGIGKIKKGYLEKMYGKRAVRQMMQVKRAFDPTGILGQGNIF